MRGAVASGHPLTSMAAIEMFTKGGNAFDAIVSAGFASIVTEPALTSLGGGGFLLTHIVRENEDILFDFFVNTPGLGREEKIPPVMKPIEIRFPGCTQVFHAGPGSVAVPGMLKGMLYIHKRLCTLPIEAILNPAVRYLREGIEVNETHELFLNYLKPIFTLTDYGKKVYMKKGRYIKRHDKIYNPLLKNFLLGIGYNGSDIYRGKTSKMLVDYIEEQNGVLSQDDLDVYNIVEREPLRIKYRDVEIITNPPPSFGGMMLALGLKLIEDVEVSSLGRDSEEFFIMLIELMKEIYTFRSEQKGDWIEKIKYPFADTETVRLIRTYKDDISKRLFTSTQGTTHISVIDEEGNAASMTTSNGSGSGCFIPETGIMLNNMMGEDDLHPEGFFLTPPGKRVSSMMAPTIVMKDGKVKTVLGSGGSKRIRTAILQVLINNIDFSYPLKEAIEASRIHFEDGIIQTEPGISADVIKRLKKDYNINLWDRKNMYFGGVHAINGNMDGWGDSRRGGNFLRS